MKNRKRKRISVPERGLLFEEKSSSEPVMVKNMITCLGNEFRRPGPPAWEVSSLSWEKVDAHVMKRLEEAGRWPMLLSGGVGTGKSCVALLLYRCASCSIVNWFDWQILIRSIALSRSEPKPMFGVFHNRYCLAEEMLHKVREYDFLVLDDIGTRTPTEPMNRAALEVCNMRRHKATIYTSNLGLNELRDVYDERFVDRIAAGTCILFDGPSKRTGI